MNASIDGSTSSLRVSAFLADTLASLALLLAPWRKATRNSSNRVNDLEAANPREELGATDDWAEVLGMGRGASVRARLFGPLSAALLLRLAVCFSLSFAGLYSQRLSRFRKPSVSSHRNVSTRQGRSQDHATRTLVPRVRNVAKGR